MSDGSRDRDDLWGGGADDADEPEPFVAGVGDTGSAPEPDEQRPPAARPQPDEDAADRDRIEIDDDGGDFDLAALEAAVAELGIEDEDQEAGEGPAATAPQPETREESAAEPGLFQQRRQPPPPPRTSESPARPSQSPARPSESPRASESAPPPAPATRDDEPAPPPMPAPPLAARPQEPAAPPAAPPTAVPAAASEEPEQAESIAALWDLASEPDAESDEPDAEGSSAVADEPGEVPGEEPAAASAPVPVDEADEADDEVDEPEVPEPSAVDIDLTNFTAKGGSGAAGRSTKRRKGLFGR